MRKILSVLALVVIGGTSVVGSVPAGALDPTAVITAVIDEAEALTTPAPAGRPQPDSPIDALAAAVDELSSALGVGPDAGSTLDALDAAAVDAITVGRLANLLGQILVCHRIADDLVGAGVLDGDPGSQARGGPRACAVDLWGVVGDLEAHLAASDVDGGDLDLWPVLRLDTVGADSVYRNDYLVIVDTGGDDVYDNNAGANLVDVNYAPPGSIAPGLVGEGDARGCSRALGGLEHTECVVTAAVVVDLAGNDVYGVRHKPDRDRVCTMERVVHRMVGVGSGLAGVGIVRDLGDEADTYTGRTVSVGAGHLYGVGVVSDAGGDDVYTAVRNSIGFGLVGGLGVVRDEGGDDTYDYYMPRGFDPKTEDQTPLAGGVLDDQADGGGPGDGVCDRTPRFTLGAGNVSAGTAGILIDDDGNDHYRGAFALSYGFPLTDVDTLAAGSMGFANNGAAGALVDRAGNDTYVAVDLFADAAVRADGTIIEPGQSATTGDAVGIGLFVDQQ